MPVDIPTGWVASQIGLGTAWALWFERLPRLAEAVLADWSLTVEGPSMNGFCSLVLPVRTDTGDRAVLKLTFDGDDESLYEGLALQRWGGDGTVRLMRADPRRRALLLERLYADDLNGLDDVEACEIVAGFYDRIHVPALPQLRTVTSYVGEWLAALATMPVDGPLPRRLVEQTLSLGGDLVDDPASSGRITHGDLHYENVLAAEREPWLVIDPKPMSGDPHYEPAPMLWNRWEQLVESGNVRSGVRRRFHTIVDAAGLDEERARDWVVVRSIINAHWAVEDAERAHRGLDDDEQAWIKLCVTTAKAVQD
ncbi:MAG: aminoglycoside resistance protein [Nocardioidaceae bacterium]|nr:aminoglycoside resistance protein [Nocardioidaceae bacterium]